MRYHIFSEDSQDTYLVGILSKDSAFGFNEFEKYYINILEDKGISSDKSIALSIDYLGSKTLSAKALKEQAEEILNTLRDFKVKYIYCVDGAMFKVLTGSRKAEPHLGYLLPCTLKGYESEGFKVVLGVNYQQLIYNPAVKEKLVQGLESIADDFNGVYEVPGTGIIKHASYPETVIEIKQALEALHKYSSLTCDIETFSINPFTCGVGSIAFAWSKHEGIAFCVDFEDTSLGGYQVNNERVKQLLKEFFKTYKGNLKFHKATFDTKVLIYELFMERVPNNFKGLLEGLHTLYNNLDDTLVIAYLALNSTADVSLSLKKLSQEFTGNYAIEEIEDISKLTKEELLEYNLIDTLATWYVYDKYEPTMVNDNQEDLYKSLMMPSQKLITQMELIGLPMSISALDSAEKELNDLIKSSLETIETSPTIKMLEALMGDLDWEHDYESRVAKAKNPSKIKPKDRDTFPVSKFNPQSPKQLQKLLYELLNLPVIDYTDTRQPATGADTLDKLINHTEDAGIKELLQAIIDLNKAYKITGTFIKAFKEGVYKTQWQSKDTLWLHGSFNIGPVSGRLSSSKPNLQNLPAGSKYGELVKSCFVAPKGWIFAGADFNSLEDYISALTTKDPNKLDVYIKGFDGHCLRAAYYFRDQLPHIDLTLPESVNSIKKTHPELRQDSKAPTFALTYQGTWKTLVSNLGWSEEKAKSVEGNYQELYKVSSQYVQEKLAQASKDGYVTVAFGLRVRTPLIQKVVWGSPTMPAAAAAEGRTAGNALGQSYGLLNNRAAVDFFKKVWASPFRYDILPCALIHDAIYVLIRDDIDVVEFANRELVKSMQWQELPEIQHDVVKIGAALDLFYPTWNDAITLPIGGSKDEIIDVVYKELDERKKST